MGPGGTSIMHISLGIVPRERPPFLALNFRSGVLSFSQLFWQKYFAPEHHQFSCRADFTFFCRSGDHHFQNFFKAQAVHRRPCCPGASGRPAGQSANQTRPSMHGQRMRIFTVYIQRPPPPLSRYKVSSGDPHFHDRARSGAPIFTLPRHMPHTYQNVGWVPPPPSRVPTPNRVGELKIRVSKLYFLRGVAYCVVASDRWWGHNLQLWTVWKVYYVHVYRAFNSLPRKGGRALTIFSGGSRGRAQ